MLQALAEIYSSMTMFFFHWGAENWAQYSALGTTSRAKWLEAFAAQCAGFSLAFLI